MQKILSLSFIVISVLISGAALAQTKAQPPKDATKQDVPKTAQPQTQDKTKEKVDDEIDLDGFFKQGEENAKNGASCNTPSAPVSPIA